MTAMHRMLRIRALTTNAITEVVAMKRAVLVSLALSFILGIGAVPPQSSANSGPVLLDSYAIKVVRPGNTWRVYLRAKHDNGSMRTIVAAITGPGVVGERSITRIRNKDWRQEFGGYLFLRTPRDRNLLRRQFTLHVFVRDSNDAKSETAEFPLAFNNKVDSVDLPAEWQDVAEQKLGAIQIQIIGDDMRRGGGGGP